MAEKGAHAGGMSPLQSLILDRMRERGWSPKDVEERGVKHATLHRYSNPIVLKQPPRKAVLQQLATALELDLAVVEQAAVESVGYAYTGRRAVEVAPELSSEEATRRIINLIRAHPGLHPVNKAHLAKQVEILALVPKDARLSPHEDPELTIEAADDRDLTTLAELSEARDTMGKSPRPPRRRSR